MKTVYYNNFQIIYKNDYKDINFKKDFIYLLITSMITINIVIFLEETRNMLGYSYQVNIFDLLCLGIIYLYVYITKCLICKRFPLHYELIQTFMRYKSYEIDIRYIKNDMYVVINNNEENAKRLSDVIGYYNDIGRDVLDIHKPMYTTIDFREETIKVLTTNIENNKEE